MSPKLRLLPAITLSIGMIGALLGLMTTRHLPVVQAAESSPAGAVVRSAGCLVSRFLRRSAEPPTV